MKVGSFPDRLILNTDIFYDVRSMITVRSHTAHSYGPRQANLVLIAYASSEGSGEPAHPRSLARTSATRSYKQ